ncbi:nitroreductase family protein [Mesorhizobium sp. DCY119]|uniref:nitroreductase family protein n=1 Tax=Mesorhizobium sp. DCY119 TaxID=2108445 RepID=UPI000E712915|nr:nitroreductase family protein [Mesorhizobium sp. DCY119]RJG40509.1 NADPH-dependent oxidoreductase [Mesorhizobium sp. DCY119]
MVQTAESVSFKTAPEDPLLGLWRKRYRGGQPPAGIEWNETIETLLSHRTVRSYLPQPLPNGAIELAVSAAQSAPSSSNLQAWNVIAVEDPALKSRLNILAGNQRHIEQAPLLLVWLADLSRLRHVAMGRHLTSDGLDYLESFLLGALDAALAAQNAVVAFESLGLGACYIGAIRNHPEKVAAELGLPPEVFAVFGMTVGVPDPRVATGVKPRLPQRAVLHRNRYTATEPADLQAYDRTLRAFQTEQAMPSIDWSEQAGKRIATAQALNNRDRLRQALTTLGFTLK